MALASCGRGVTPNAGTSGVAGHATGTSGLAGSSGTSGTAGVSGAIADGGSTQAGTNGAGGDSARPGSSSGGNPDGAVGDGDAASAAARLVPWQVLADGTPPLVVGVFDTQEQVHCRFLPDEAGQLRCLPWGLAPLTETPWFSDSKCQNHVYQSDPMQGRIVPGRPVAAPLPRVDCQPKRYVVATLRVMASDEGLFAGATCAPMVQTQFGGYVNVTVDQVQAPDRWATVTEVDGPLLANRVRLRQVATADGTRFGNHLVDQTFGTPCTLESSADPSAAGLTCVPPLLSQSGREGADCTGSVLAWRAAACSDPAAIGTPSSELFSLGPQWTGPVSIQLHGCQLISGRSTLDGPDQFFERGPSLGTVGVASAALKAQGAGRFMMTGLLGPNGELVPIDDEIATPNDWLVPRYFDQQANTPCDPRWTPEGVVRCIPKSVMTSPTDLGIFFADAACKDTAYFCARADQGGCDGVPMTRSAIDANGETRITSLNSAQVVTTVYTFGQGGVGTCVTMPPNPSGASFFKAGSALPWTMYPELFEMNGRPSGAP
jgi:hypothetical protein